VAAAKRADPEPSLRDDAAAAWDAIDPAAVDDALAETPRAWTVADFALRGLAAVNVIDRAVYGCREAIWRRRLRGAVARVALRVPPRPR
jgi:hypothetical protein